MVYDKKLVLHIPHFAWIDLNLIEVNHVSFKEALYKGFEQIGVSSWYSTMVNGAYKGREYEEENLTIYCDSIVVNDIISEFLDIVRMHHFELRQELYAYELGNELVTVEVD